MKAPEHYRPFNIEQAKAGAPYGCINGQEATILKWDARFPNRPLLGIYSRQDCAIGWSNTGESALALNSGTDLIMLPLGMCEGKPVFYGDELNNVQGKKFTAKIETSLYENCTWPRAEPEYPKTRMTAEERWNSIKSAGIQSFNIGTGRNEGSDRLEHSPGDVTEAIANAAIAHAIQSGDIFTKDEISRQVEMITGTRINFYGNGERVTIEKDKQVFYPGSLIGDAAQEMRDRLEKRMGTINIFDDELLASEVEKFIKEKHRG